MLSEKQTKSVCSGFWKDRCTFIQIIQLLKKSKWGGVSCVIVQIFVLERLKCSDSKGWLQLQSVSDVAVLASEETADASLVPELKKG